MPRKKAIIILPRLNDRGGILAKQWFVEYSCRNPHTDEMKRFRIYEGFSELKTAEERYVHANKIITEVTEKLQNDGSPFDKPTVIYEDEIMYSHAARIWGKEKKSIVTIRSYLSEFLLEKKDELIKHSYQTYQSKFRIFCSWMEIKKLDKIHVSFITNQHIIEFLKYVSNHNQLSRRTVSKYRQMLHCFFEWLIRNKGVIDRNPVYGIPQIGKIKDESPCPIPDQEREVLKVYMKAKDPQLWLVCLFEYYCAIRPHEELRHLKIGDINFESHTITIRNDIAKNHLTETVDIPDQLFEEITKTYKLHEYPQDYYVFSLNRQPGPVHLGKSNFRNRFYEIRKVLGLSSKYKLYGFKHTGASKLVDAGASTCELQRHFRHKSITTTEAYFRKNLGLKSKKLKSDFPDI